MAADRRPALAQKLAAAAAESRRLVRDILFFLPSPMRMRRWFPLAAHSTEQAGEATTRAAIFDALLAANKVSLPEAMVEQDMRNSAMRIVQSMHERGMEPSHEMLEDEAFRAEVRKRSEQSLRLSVLLRAIRGQGKLELDEKEIDEEIASQAEEHPEDQRDQFKSWFVSQKEQMDLLRDRLIEEKCVDFVLSKAKIQHEVMSLSQWQAKQETDKESA